MFDMIPGLLPYILLFGLLSLIINAVALYTRSLRVPPRWVYKRALKEVGVNKPFITERVNGKWRVVAIENEDK
ncbi:hypothetical protein [Cytobacillus gottheilii]|uniref:hypothetical protein n=1 Tax=Cytobacillus gottheilii TaxID=859144 RepID=UPI0024955AA8|nr:hypothetical protein [Cytobacillus gottheilii]